MQAKWYVGIFTDSTVRESFKSAVTPTRQTHGELYSAVIGPFRTKRGADFMTRFGTGNPHCQNVDDAERLARN